MINVSESISSYHSVNTVKEMTFSNTTILRIWQNWKNNSDNVAELYLTY